MTTCHDDQLDAARIAGGLVVCSLDADDEGRGILLHGLDACDTGRVALMLAAWYATLLRMFCALAATHGEPVEDPVTQMREFLLTVTR